MTLTENGVPVTVNVSTGATTTNLHGADITATQWNSATWWSGTAGFPATSWTLVNNRLPFLKKDDGQPFREAQNPVVNL
jgi:hypothetical protein